MELDERILKLIAVGASIGANCSLCLQSNIALGLESGADEQEIEAAIAVGKRSGGVPQRWTGWLPVQIRHSQPSKTTPLRVVDPPRIDPKKGGRNE